MRATSRCSTVIALALSLVAPGVLAQAPATRATVVRIDGPDVFLDVGSDRVRLQERLTVFRHITVRHPITRAKLDDRFAIGEVTVVQTGAALTLVRALVPPSRPFEVGDTLDLRAPVPPPVSASAPAAAVAGTTSAAATSGAPPPPPSQVAPMASADADTLDVVRTWYATLGKLPVERARLYREFLRRAPRSRYAPVVAQEVTYLEGLGPQGLSARASPRAPTPSVQVHEITLARAGASADLALSVRASARIRGLVVHARPRGTRSYRSLPMQLDGRGHARARIPAEVVREAGFEYFVEAVDERGEPHAVIGTASAPREVDALVDPRKPLPDTSAPRTRVKFTSEVASFDGTTGRDFFFINEGDFLYRVQHAVLYAVRMGYGHFLGQGGTVEELDELKLDPKVAGFSYGFVEVELAAHRLFGVAGRVTVGLGRPELASEEREGLTGGAQLRLRVGSAEGTHLVVAGEALPEIGQRAYIGLNWEALRGMPMETEVEVTDQPVDSDELAVRLVQEIGWRVTDRFVVALRPSYQLRTIKHAGPGIGAALSFDW